MADDMDAVRARLRLCAGVDDPRPDEAVDFRMLAPDIRALLAENERLANKLNTDSQNFELECRKANEARLTAEVERLREELSLTWGDRALDENDKLRAALAAANERAERLPKAVDGALIALGWQGHARLIVHAQIVEALRPAAPPEEGQ